jgi:hypothetical protein
MTEIDLVNGGVDEHFLRRYRALLDAESDAFDELEHAYEDGDRSDFERDLDEWHRALERRAAFLDRNGVAATPVAASR